MYLYTEQLQNVPRVFTQKLAGVLQRSRVRVNYILVMYWFITDLLMYIPSWLFFSWLPILQKPTYCTGCIRGSKSYHLTSDQSENCFPGSWRPVALGGKWNKSVS